MFHLGWFLSYYPQGWNEGHSDRGNYFPNPDAYVDFARALERAGFDYMMIEDGSFIPDAFGSSMEYSLSTTFAAPKHDPMALVPLLAQATEHIGIIATMTTTFYPPFLAARLMTTLDHLSHGRVGFNLVTSHNDRTAQNYGLDKQYPHDERYAIATDWAKAVTALLTSWDDDAVLDDVEAGVYADHTKIHQVDYEGTYFSTRGPLNAPPGPQRLPVICQAGGSPVGREFASTYADTIVAPSGTVEWMTEYRKDIRARVAAHGRNPDDVKVMFLTDFIIGDTHDDALELQRRKQAEAESDVSKTLARMSFASGIDFAAFDLDQPVPAFETNAARTTTDAFFKGREHLTLREIATQLPPSLTIVGSPATAADQMEAVMEEVGGDGFLIGSSVTPRAVADFAGDLAPELRRRGLIRDGYADTTFKNNLRAF
ncbi:FMN-dependent oxidoreductase (nitrilotriacetate monooxygenase family) [Frondihabitans sp. PhB188]|uniref:NtaA/DmoA family FMN-dependent monooxygenase n=1 Tax=Frondihabitans sp. PhB188 TaxID=2485200 RepID=UPI000F49A3F6|nr:NtaA/DmoA family FMN-dependent monooxygenase [Frondihabitans sp. PhB188]ROQ39710.1 FMN-dependent oxidoreductase (nitrilotriacetate monooxygenase family) [Frondihabitans sp. PhB188]